MIRLMAAAGLAASFVFSPAAFAATTEQKMETCKFGADDKKLAGAARKSFITKCMSNKDSPRGKAAPAPKPQ
jgi:psiF repeat